MPESSTPLREQVAQAIVDYWAEPDGYRLVEVTITDIPAVAGEVTDALMPLIEAHGRAERVAELREAADDPAVARTSGSSGPYVHAWLRSRADRIERTKKAPLDDSTPPRTQLEGPMPLSECVAEVRDQLLKRETQMNRDHTRDEPEGGR